MGFKNYVKRKAVEAWEKNVVNEKQCDICGVTERYFTTINDNLQKGYACHKCKMIPERRGIANGRKMKFGKLYSYRRWEELTSDDLKSFVEIIKENDRILPKFIPTHESKYRHIRVNKNIGKFFINDGGEFSPISNIYRIDQITSFHFEHVYNQFREVYQDSNGINDYYKYKHIKEKDRIVIELNDDYVKFIMIGITDKNLKEDILGFLNSIASNRYKWPTNCRDVKNIYDT